MMEEVKEIFTGHMKKVSKYLRSILSLALLFLLATGLAGELLSPPVSERQCLAISSIHKSHDIAIRLLMDIPEVQQWKEMVIKNKRQVATIPNTNNTVFHDGQCFWEMSLYEVADGQFLRWNAYQISLSKQHVYRVDIVNPGQLITIKSFLHKKTGATNE